MDTLDLIAQYIAYLENNHSKITIKNYVSDIKHFIAWFDKNEGVAFSPDLLSKTVIENYKNSLYDKVKSGNSPFSYKSLTRHLSSFRSFTNYLLSQELLTQNPFEKASETVSVDPWKIKEFKNYLYERQASNLTIKYYINDIQSFKKWTLETSGKNVYAFTNITSELINEYTERLSKSLLLSPKTINRKLSSIRRYLQFAKLKEIGEELRTITVEPTQTVGLDELTIPITHVSQSKILPVGAFNPLLTPYLKFEEKAASLISSKIASMRLREFFKAEGRERNSLDKALRNLSGKNIKKEFYAPYSVSTASFPTHKKILFHLKNTRPEWYKRYHTYPFVHYLHFAILTIAAVFFSVFLYHNTIGRAGAESFDLGKTLRKT